MSIRLYKNYLLILLFTSIASQSYAASKKIDFPDWGVGVQAGITDPNASYGDMSIGVSEDAIDYDIAPAISVNITRYLDPKVGIDISYGFISGIEPSSVPADDFSIHYANISLIGTSTTAKEIRFSTQIGVGYYLFDTALATHEKLGGVIGLSASYPLSNSLEASLGYQFHKIERFKDTSGSLSIDPHMLKLGLLLRF